MRRNFWKILSRTIGSRWISFIGRNILSLCYEAQCTKTWVSIPMKCYNARISLGLLRHINWEPRLRSLKIIHLLEANQKLAAFIFTYAYS
jgi:hypothetical protein